MIITEFKLNKVGWKGSGFSLSIKITLYCLSRSVRLSTDGYNDDVYVDLFSCVDSHTEQRADFLRFVYIICSYMKITKHHLFFRFNLFSVFSLKN